MHTRKEGLVASWEAKLYKKHYVRVFIWDSAERLNEVNNITKAMGYAIASNCVTEQYTGTLHVPKKFGEIHLVHEKYGSGTVAHEIFHIISFWMMFYRWGLKSHNERAARLTETLTRTFWQGHFKNIE